MSRYIDADMFGKEIREWAYSIMDANPEQADILLKMSILIDNYPTAFDIDGVAKALRNACNEYYSEDAAIPYDKAVEIVKAGRVYE